MSLGVVWTAILLVASLVWCGAMARRWREDLAAIQKPNDPSDRTVALLLWGVTLLAAWVIVSTLVRVLGNLIG